MSPAAAKRAVHLDVADPTLRFALAHACHEAGWPRSAAAAADAWLVNDRVPAPGAVADVLVVPLTPLACRRALDAFAAGLVRAVVPSDEPWALPPALDLAGTGMGCVPHGLVEQAQRFPPLRPRLERTLHLVVRGATVAAMSRALHQSPSSTKRDIAELLRLCDAPSRVALAATVVRLGMPPS